MPDTIRLVIAWTCVAVFVASALITILALLGVIRLPDPKYLNRLFTVIIVAIVGTCAGFFKDFLSSGTSPIVTKPVTNAVVPGAVKPVPEKGWVGFKNTGAYVAKFYVNWKENGQPQSWASGEKAVGQSGVVSLSGSVSDIKINAQAHTGFKWATIFTLELTNGPPNETYVVQGTTLDRKWTTDSRMP